MPHATRLFKCPSCTLAVLLFAIMPLAADAQTVLLDFGNNNSFRGLSVPNPDGNGNYWNSLQTGLFYSNLVDISNNSTTIDFGFSTAVGTDSYNGPAGPTGTGTLATDVLNTDIDAAALGQLGGSVQAAFDYVAGGPGAVRFEIQQLDANKTYDLTFFGSHKYSTDSTTVYNVYSDNTYTNLVSSVSLNHQNPLNPAEHNRAGLATLSGVVPQAANNLYVEFVGNQGNAGYLNAMRISESQPQPPSSPKVLMHYMPWFDTPTFLGGNNGTSWQGHWNGFGATNPNNVDAQGRRDIASNYYPKIGPYQSSDPKVIEYHMLLMKLAGIDGVLVDWYGVQGTNGDIVKLFNNSEAIVNKVDDYGLEFAVVLEDRFAANTSQVKANVEWLKNNYFNRSEYVRMGPGNDPLMPVFGPITQQTEAAWNTILANVPDVELLTLWYESGDAGVHADGEYAWPYENETLDDYLIRLTSFYVGRATTQGTVGAAVYPGFDAFGGGTFTIPHDNGQTLANTLALYDQHQDQTDFLQLITWNDFGEGTILEPTIETGFDYLMQIQQFTDSPYGEAELQLVFDLYRARVEFAGNSGIQSLLDQAAANLNAFQINDAQAIMESIYVPGDFNGDGTANGADFLLWQRQVGLVQYDLLNLNDADGNGDGVVDAQDLAIWQAAQGGIPLAGSAAVVPEPTATALGYFILLYGIVVTRFRG